MSMINYTPEIIALFEKYKDVETPEEWNMLVKELGNFNQRDPKCRALLLRCFNKIKKIYDEKARNEHINT